MNDLARNYLKAAMGMLDWLDPIMGYDISCIICSYSTDKAESMRTLKMIYAECLTRANVHAGGALREGWNTAMDALNCAITLLEGSVTCN
jgi:hypothetical protein